MPVADKKVIPTGDISLSDAEKLPTTSPGKKAAGGGMLSNVISGVMHRSPLRASGDVSLSDADLVGEAGNARPARSPSPRKSAGAGASPTKSTGYNLRSGIAAVLGANHPHHMTGDIALADAMFENEDDFPHDAARKNQVKNTAGAAKQKAGQAAEAVKAKANEGLQAAKDTARGASRSPSPTRDTKAAGQAAVNAGKRKADQLAKDTAANAANLEARAAEGFAYGRELVEEGIEATRHRIEDGIKFAKQTTGLGATDASTKLTRSPSPSRSPVREAGRGAREAAIDAGKNVSDKAADLKATASARAEQGKQKAAEIKDNAAAAYKTSHNHPVQDALNAAKNTAARSPSRSPTRKNANDS